MRIWVLVLVCTISTSCWAGLSDGLVAYYSFDGNADDRSGNGHHGGVYGALLTSGHDGTSNSAYKFDGQNDYVSVPYSSAFQLSTFTYSAWVKPSKDLFSAGNVVIMGRGEDPSSDHASAFFLVANPDPTFGQGVTIYYEDSSDGDRFYGTGFYPSVGAWTHLAATRTPGGAVDVYVNGFNFGHWDSTPNPTTQCFVDFVIGSRMYGSGSTYGLTDFFPGAIDEVRVYNRALNPNEIARLSTIPAPGALLIAAIGLATVRLKKRRVS